LRIFRQFSENLLHGAAPITGHVSDDRHVCVREEVELRPKCCLKIAIKDVFSGAEGVLKNGPMTTDTQGAASSHAMESCVLTACVW
jgi:hypothetical protein